MTETPDSDGDALADADRDRGPGRRTLLRVVIAVAVAVPVVVEGLTLTSLLGESLFGDGAAEESTDGAAGTGVDSGTETVGVGDELLPGTPQTETLTGAALRVGGDSWVFRVDVAVDNGADASYDLRLGAVTTDDGTTVDGGVSRTVPPDESATVSAAWGLPEGATPATLSVVAVSSSSETTREVPLGHVPRTNGAG
jgi:hypothetical protein